MIAGPTGGNQIKDFSEQNGISEHVRFAVMFQHAGLLLCIRHVYIANYDRRTWYYHIGGHVFGLPIIATSTGGIPELIKNGENGILVKPIVLMKFRVPYGLA